MTGRTRTTAVLFAFLLVPAGAAAGGRWAVRFGWPDLQSLPRGDVTEARRQLKDRLRADPRGAALRLAAARLARQAGDYGAAREQLAACRKLGGEAEGVRLEELLLRAQGGDVDAVARGLITRAEKNRAEAPLIFEALARGYLEDGRLARGYHCLAAWLERQPESARALLWRAWALERLGRLREAVEDERQAVKLAPGWDEARLQLGAALLDEAQVPEAAELYERLLRDRPKDLAVRLGLARARLLQGRSDEARRLLDDLLKEHPRDAGALRARAKLALQQGQAAEAEVRLRQALKRDPSDREAVYLLFVCLRMQGKDREAREQETRMKRIQDDLTRLEAILTAKLAEAPRDPGLRCEVAQIFLRNGRDREGLRWLGIALRIDPGHRPSLLALADYYERIGNRELAERHRRLAGPK